MVRTKQTKRRNPNNGDDNAENDSPEANSEDSEPTPAEEPKTPNDLEQMINSADISKKAAAAEFINEKLSNTKEIKKFFDTSDIASSCLMCCVGSLSTEIISAACNIVSELPVDWKEVREALASKIVAKDMFDDNESIDKAEYENIGGEYGSLLSSCFRNNSKKDSDAIMQLWSNFFSQPSIYYACLINNNQYYWNLQKPSDDQIRDMLSEAKGYVQSAQDFPVLGEKKMQSLVKNGLSQIINRIIQWSSSAKQFEDEILELFDECKQSIRPGWMKVVEGRDDCYSDTEYENSDGEDEDVASDDAAATALKNADKPLAHGNMTIKERIINCIIQQMRYNYGHHKLLSRMITEYAEFMIQRVSEVFNQMPEENSDMNNVRLDPITNLMRTFVLSSACSEHPKAGSKHSSAVMQIIRQHPDGSGISAATKMYPYDSTAVNTYIERLFEFCKTCNGSMFKLLETVARYDESGTVLEQQHVDHLDGILVNNVIESDEIPDCLSALQTIAESRPELLMGKGDAYYDAALRVSEDPEEVWSKIDNILKCRAFISDEEAADSITLMIDSVSTIPASSHIANVLETLQTIAIVNKPAVKPFRPWICEQGENAYLKKNVVKLLLVLDGPNLNSGGSQASSSGGGGGEKTSSTCTVS